MVHVGKCPNCKSTTSHIMIEPVELWLGLGGKQRFKGNSYYCSHCHAILGVGIDPYGLKNEIVSALARELHRG